MERYLLTLTLVCCASMVVVSAVDWRVQRLNKFQSKYNNSRSDIIFLLDVSGSVSNSGFNTEKEFISSLLSKISVQAIATRVSLITFGYSVREDIDYIDYDYSQVKNKCTFNRDFAKVNHRYGRATNMNGALKKAKEILDRAKSSGNKRRNVNTVIVLLTDGYWNQGGEPYTVARTLRDRNQYDAEIFSVGVGWSLSSQLEKVSGSKDNVVTARSFADFGGLATRIRGDQVEKLYQAVIAKRCGTVCDKNALCSCGTISGIYQCACLPGYKGSGIPGKCHKCPHGTYKTFTSPDPNCKSCPANAITKKMGSTSIHDCYCQPGFTGHPNLGQPCKTVECASLGSTIKNGKVASCGKYYKETCTFTCNKNYHIANEVATSKKLTCLINGRWNQAMPACVITTCQSVVNPPKLSSTCTGDKVGDKCAFRCDKGYNLVGPNERECKQDGSWSHSLAHCEVITCPSVRKIDNVNIEPVHCMTKTTNYNDGCAYSCKPGFKFESGHQKRVCSHDGTWVGNELSCIDKTPPTINCPESIFAETDLGQSFKEINWPQPTIIDNSITGSDDITLTHFPANIKSPYKFPIGVTIVTYNASDQHGNSDSCVFRVDIIDRELPRFTYCPADISVSAEAGANKKSISWKNPEFSDNSDSVKLIYSTYDTNPKDFNVGPIHNVKYTIQDSSTNSAECAFFVQVKEKTCPPRDPPINGALSCQYVGNTFGTYCTISCQNPYTFNGPAAYGYVCGTNAQWSVLPPVYGFPWPDCTILQPQQGMGQHLRFFYFTGNCQSSKDQIANNFIQILDKFLRNDGGCSDPSNARVCEAKKVEVTCGKTQAVNGRFRRAAPGMTIDIEIDVRSKEDETTQEDAVKSLTNLVKGVKSDTSSEAQSLKKITVGDDTLELEHVESVGSISAVCADGQVYGTVKTGAAGEKKTCKACLAGQYYNTKSSKCEKCPKGTYTEKPGLLGCPSCPHGTTTAKDGTSDAKQCRKPCSPGTFSSDGLAPCRPCEVGSYQISSRATTCVSCPGVTVTANNESTSLSQCRMMCPKGMFSKSGLEPCSLCPVGHYQPNKGKKDCIQCPGADSTYAVGSVEASQCKYIDNCVSSPCLNGASCKNEVNDFTCTCKAGYRGKRCQEEKNECADKPCYGDAACVDKIDGFECVCPPLFHGKFCSDKHPGCTSSLCQNGGSCGESPNGPHCSCQPGWVGKFCERTVNECESKPCGPGSTCIDDHRGYRCVCAAGYTGATCHEQIDNCAQNDQCLNGGVCVDGITNFQCQCKPGYAGERCEVNVDECASNPCRNSAICIDGVDSYTCKCAARYHGDKCQHLYSSSDFDLVFNRAIQGYAETEFYQDLSQFTASFWLKVKKDIETGTVMSYSFGNDDSFQDNGLVIRDPDSLTLVVLGEEANLDISVTDDEWHHVAITWSSQAGKYVGYKDGIRMSEGNLKQGQFIPANGVFILGQEQDEVGRNFSAGEAFNGKLSQFNLWKKVLPDSEIADLASYRCVETAGNVIAWADFGTLPTDEVKKEVSFCAVKNTKFSAWGVNAKSACPGYTTKSQCVSTDNLSIEELNLLDTSCTPSGFTCGNQKKHDSTNTNTCPTSTKNRFECPHQGRKDCTSNSCSRRGSCSDTLMGYVCTCNDGYHGKNCQNSVPCHHIKTIANGIVHTSGQSVSFTCKKGYQLQGASSLTCNAGKYNAAIPVCQDINECLSNSCGQNSRCTNLPGSFKCDCVKGFKLSTPTLCTDANECDTNNGNCQDKCINNQGSYSCGCRSGYRISVDKHSCEDVNECSSSGSNNCMQKCVNTRGSHECQCEPGYHLAADKSSCTATKCAGVRSPVNGHVSQGYGDYKTLVTYSCTNSMHRLNGPIERSCQANGQWSGREPTCDRVNCGTLPSPYNGLATHQGNTYKFTCLKGFLLIGDLARPCQTNGAWSGQQPRCVQQLCPILAAPANGKVVGNSYTLNAAIMASCNEGYMLEDERNSRFRICQQGGAWSGKVAKCIALNCGAPASIDNGAISGSRYNYKDQVTYTCSNGYGLSGNNARTCQLNGEWSGIKPACLFNSCGYPGSVSNGQLVGGDYSFGMSVSYKCNAGFRLSGNNQRQCMKTGKWTGSTPLCQEILCPVAQEPANGEKTGILRNVGARVTYDCLPGFSLSGARNIKCGANGQWEAQAPTCVAGACGSPKLVGPSGTVSSPGYPNSYPNNAYCRSKIVVAQSKKVAFNIPSFKTESSKDVLELRDGKTGHLLYLLSGVLRSPLQITSPSNEMDVRFITNNNATLDGFTSNYFASACGGQITSLGQTIQTPGYPSNYAEKLSCSWQIILPGEKFKLKFENFETRDSYDTLEAWSAISRISSQTKLGTYYGNRGSFLTVKSQEVMYLKFTSDAFFGAKGFRATVVRDDSI